VIYSCREMRFRAKFGADGWCVISLACFALVLWFSGLHSRLVGTMAICWTIVALQRVLGQVFVYWELDFTSLRERRFWKMREIRWEEVSHVGSMQPSSSFLEVDFVRHPVAAESSLILILKMVTSSLPHYADSHRRPASMYRTSKAPLRRQLKSRFGFSAECDKS